MCVRRIFAWRVGNFPRASSKAEATGNPPPISIKYRGKLRPLFKLALSFLLRRGSASASASASGSASAGASASASASVSASASASASMRSLAYHCVP